MIFHIEAHVLPVS